MAIQTEATSRLAALVEGFDRDTETARIRIRELLEKDPRLFHEGIAPILSSSANPRGVQFAVGLLVSGNCLTPALCNPRLNLEQAVSLARLAHRVDPAMDIKLAKQVAEDATLGEPVANVGRILDVLNQTSTDSRITASLARLSASLMRHLRNPDPEVRSKAVLLIGRSSKNVKWVQSRMTESDPRTRANAVEAIWGVDTAEARELLRNASRDDNNRVAANAMIALYRIGDLWAIAEMVRMAASDDALFRSSAAWAMGETGDPRFSETLGHMLGEPNAMVRRRAFAALSRIKAAVKARNGRVWRVTARALPVPEGLCQVRLSVTPTDESEPPNLRATQFLLSADGQPVSQYQVEARALGEALAVTFLFPCSDSGAAPWIQGAIECLPSKRPSDQWCATFYLPAREAAGATPTPPQFAAENEAVLAALQRPAPKTECPAFWDAIRNSVQADGAPTGTARHLIVLNQSTDAPPPDLEEIIAAATSADTPTSVQAISLAPSSPLEELCRRTQGNFQLAASEVELSRLIEEAHTGLLARYLVSCQIGPDTRELNVRVFDATGWGEATVSL